MTRQSATALNRRQLFSKVIPACGLCTGCALVTACAETAVAQAPPANAPARPAATQASAAAKHKFEADSQMSFTRVYHFAFAHQAGVLKAMAAQIGEEKLIAMVKEASSQVATAQGKVRGDRAPNRTLATFLGDMRTPDHFWKNVLTYEFVEWTEKAAEVRVSECLWAKTFRQWNAGELGYALICHPDFAAAVAFNPKMKMIRTKTLMQGHDHCNHRWVLEA